ncbi:hypothetical protein MSG28_004635 [Choristoneura fumiferana]|uniref:Uncharacterized protein n=1 Tax=Choristoneura fumiferana TaxID=7141 RepID=A0ACC0K6R2_CHOFU|nr:hypothetical protein MSG28_004635 [Choristoneura fumiferana]
MTLENMLSNMGIGTKQLSESSYGGGGHKSNAAMQALTLLAFLFFLHILQQCLKDHMTAMQTPQIMVMSGSREGEVNIAKRADIKKLDKSGNVVPTDEKRGSQTDRNKKHENEKNISPEYETSDDLYLTKITTAEKSPKIGSQKYKSYFKNYANRSSGFRQFISAQNDYL